MISNLLKLLAALNGPKIKEFFSLVTALLALFGGLVPVPGASGGANLENVQLSEEDNKNVAIITEKLTADSGGTTQAAFDIGKLMSFIKLMRALLQSPS